MNNTSFMEKNNTTSPIDYDNFVLQPLSDADIDFLNNLVHSIRETGRLIDTPANLMTTSALVEEAKNVANQLNSIATVQFNAIVVSFSRT